MSTNGGSKANWLKSRMDQLGISTLQLSRQLKEQFGLNVSRQVLDNWQKMEGERIPISIGNPHLVTALADCLQYYDVAFFLYELGYGEFIGELDTSPEMMNVMRRLSSYTGQDAQAIALMVQQILDGWNDVGRLMGRS